MVAETDPAMFQLIHDELIRQRGYMLGVREVQAAHGQQLVGIKEQVNKIEKRQTVQDTEMASKGVDIAQLKTRLGLAGGVIALTSVAAGVIFKLIGA